MDEKRSPVYLRILGAFLALQGAVLILSLIAVERIQKKTTHDWMRAYLQTAAGTFQSETSERTNRIFTTLRRVLDEGAEDEFIGLLKKGSPAGAIRLSERIRSRLRAEYAVLLDANGEEIGGDLINGNLPEAFLVASRGGVGSSIGVLNGRLGWFTAVPVSREGAKGVVGVVYDVERRGRRLPSVAPDSLIFFSYKGRVLATSEPKDWMPVKKGDSVEFSVDRISRIKNGEKEIGIISKKFSPTVTLHVATPFGSLLAPFDRLRRMILAVGVSAFILTALAGFVISRGITKSIQNLIDRLRESNERLTRLNAFKDQFFRTVTHDVQNPLTAIMGYAELLAESPGKVSAASVDGLTVSAAALNTIISDLVDFAAIEQGTLRIERREMDLVDAIRALSTRMVIVAGRRNIRFNLGEIPESIPMVGDPNRLSQVMQNLCSNAVNYTREGKSVTLSASVDSDGVAVEVRDEGIGISEEDLPRIFNRFFQAGNAKKVRSSGMGLGLSICSEIVKAHGGRIEVRSRLGEGSVFTIRLPIKDKQQGAESV